MKVMITATSYTISEVPTEAGTTASSFISDRPNPIHRLTNSYPAFFESISGNWPTSSDYSMDVMQMSDADEGDFLIFSTKKSFFVKKLY